MHGRRARCASKGGGRGQGSVFRKGDGRMATSWGSQAVRGASRYSIWQVEFREGVDSQARAAEPGSAFLEREG